MTSFTDTNGVVMPQTTRTFKTAGTDNTAPRISTIRPNGTSVSVNERKLSITFDEPMDRTYGDVSMNKSISLSNKTWVNDYTVEYDMSSLSYSTEYTVTVRNFRDKAYNTMSTDYKYFTTERRSGDYLITYHRNGGTGDMWGNPFSVNRGGSHSVERNDFYRSGYEFVEWNTRSDGYGTRYYVNDTIRDIRSDVNLYAIWRYTGSSSGGWWGGGSSSSSSSSSTVSPSNGNTVSSTTSANSIRKHLNNRQNPQLIFSSRAQEIELTGSSLRDVASDNRYLTITKDEMSVIMTSDFIDSLNLSTGDDVVLKLKPTKASVNSSIKSVDRANDKLVDMAFDITLSVNGKNQTWFSEGLELEMNLSNLNLTSSQKDKATGVRFDSSREITKLGGEWNGSRFRFKTGSLSTYGVLLTDYITRISMNVGSSQFTVNDVQRSIDVAPIISNGRTMVPIRFVAEALGAEVGWTEYNQTVTINMDGRTLRLVVGVLSDGMDTAPFIRNDRVLIPLRYVSENFGANVLWTEAGQKIEIVK